MTIAGIATKRASQCKQTFMPAYLEIYTWAYTFLIQVQWGKFSLA